MSDNHSYYNTIYRNDTSNWSNKRFDLQNNLKSKLEPKDLAEKNSSIKRSLLNLEKINILNNIPESTTKSTYKSPIPMERSIEPTFSPRLPNGLPPPELIDNSILRPTTEYRSRYNLVKSEQFFKTDITNKSQIIQNNFKNIEFSQNAKNPTWNSTYRINQKFTPIDKSMNNPITFNSFTHLR